MPGQWTVGQLRAELVGLPDDMPVAVDVEHTAGSGEWERYVLTGAGFGAGVDPEDPLFTGGEYPLAASSRTPDAADGTR